ncbi:hypothetical protein NDU88_001981 [Pleurodeles waltl]|uniref:Uncharacterized protein n=1 Tax=Pleurodeles waltl TaxID=8319 RepID=A0AAV7UWZ7_PLEWA|nr:hypothetical protein NDU88_001981 [Pleurodeles waltl]
MEGSTVSRGHDVCVQSGGGQVDPEVTQQEAAVSPVSVGATCSGREERTTEGAVRSSPEFRGRNSKVGSQAGKGGGWFSVHDIWGRMTEFQEVAQAEVTPMGKYALAHIYGEVERRGASLASTLRHHQEDNTISQMLDNDGGVWSDLPSVVQQFHDYYTGLCRSRSQLDEMAVEDYLAHSAMSWLTEEHRVRLMGPQQPEEFRVALVSMPTGKSPSTNRLMVAFYKAYQDILILHLVTLFEEMATGGCMQPTMLEALLVVLLKPRKLADR